MDPRSSRPGPGILFVMPASPVLRAERRQLQPLAVGEMEPLRGLLSLEPVRRFLLDGRGPRPGGCLRDRNPWELERR
jgi:hypothetical protein